MPSIENIYDNIITQQFTWVKIFDLEGDLQGSLCGSGKKSVTPSAIKKYVQEFISDNPGVYNFEFKRFFNSRQPVKYKKITSATGTGISLASSFNEPEERNKIRLQIFEEEKEKKLKLDYESKIRELDTVWGKVGYMVQKLLEQNNVIPKGMLQGNIPLNASTTTMTHQPIDPTTFTQDQKNMSNEALLLLLQCVNPETLHKVATTLKNNPAKLQMLIQFVNS